MTDANGFVLHDGRTIHSVPELVSAIETLDQATYAQYCNEYKNDFASWIRSALHESQLADILEETRSREAAINILRTFVRLHSDADPFEVEHSASERKRFVFHKKPSRSEPIEPDRPRFEEPIAQHEPKPPIEKEPFEERETPPPQSGQVRNAFTYAAQNRAQPDGARPFTDPQRSTQPAPVDPNAAYEPKNTQFTASGEEVLTEAVVEEYAETLHAMRSEINKVFIGQEEIVEQVLLCLMCDSHSLLEGVPGLAKSLLVETLMHVVDGTSFKRIQFIPDLLPSDVIGGQIYNPKTQELTVIKGPIFANFVLADEINRAPPKTHAAVMEAMQEKKINIDKEEFDLDPPFLIIATQNPLENKGTYELPEAVLDRFMFKLDLDYPSRKDEKIIITENATTKKYEKQAVQKVVTKERFLQMQRNVKNVYLSERIREYILDLVEATRGINKDIEGFQFVKYGAGPRASIYLGVGAKARAIMQGRNYVLPDDVNFVAKPILRHRVALNFKGKAHGIKSDRIVEEILHKVTTL
jgi:MoxR-like ATPase